MRKYTVYKTIDITNDCYYYGVHLTNNPEDYYLGSGIRITRAVNKRGRINFQKEILFSFEDKKVAYNKEKEIVSPEELSNPKCYNIARGGLGGNLNDVGRLIRNKSELTKLRIYGSKAGPINSFESKKKAEEVKLERYGSIHGVINHPANKIKSGIARSLVWKAYNFDGSYITEVLNYGEVCKYMGEPRDGNTPYLDPVRVWDKDNDFKLALTNKIKSAFLIEIRNNKIYSIFRSGKGANKYLNGKYQDYIKCNPSSVFYNRESITSLSIDQLVKFND